ncbi:MAG: hypothetical protein JSS81_00290 [Acidobacteria bacterium]|nr:hypothetical protein [Acidobacteriota bacterium]
MKKLSVTDRRSTAAAVCQFLLTAGIFLFVLHFAPTAVRAQQDEDPPNAALPPVKVISKDEKSALDAEGDVKQHTKLAIELMEARLKKAETLSNEEAFNAMFNELGGFHALMDDTLKYLDKNDVNRGRVLDTFKRFEMALRSFTPRIELIRRTLPERFEYYVRRLLKSIRTVREKAVEPMFSDSIVPN